MGDDEYGAPFHKLVHTLLYQVLCPCVDRACRLVEDQHRRIGNSGTRYGQKLPLPLRQIRPVICDKRVISIGKPSYERVGIGDRRGLLDILIRGVQPPEPDVLPYRPREEMGILQHVGEGMPEIRQPYVPYVYAVIEYRA